MRLRKTALPRRLRIVDVKPEDRPKANKEVIYSAQIEETLKTAALADDAPLAAAGITSRTFLVASRALLAGLLKVLGDTLLEISRLGPEGHGLRPRPCLTGCSSEALAPAPARVHDDAVPRAPSASAQALDEATLPALARDEGPVRVCASA